MLQHKLHACRTDPSERCHCQTLPQRETGGSYEQISGLVKCSGGSLALRLNVHSGARLWSPSLSRNLLQDRATQAIAEDCSHLEYASCEHGGKSGVLACFFAGGARLPPSVVDIADSRVVSALPLELVLPGVCRVQALPPAGNYPGPRPRTMPCRCSTLKKQILQTAFHCQVSRASVTFRGRDCCTASSASSLMSARCRSLAFIAQRLTFALPEQDGAPRLPLRKFLFGNTTPGRNTCSLRLRHDAD